MPTFYYSHCLRLVECFILLNIFWPPPSQRHMGTIFLCVISLCNMERFLRGPFYSWKMLLYNLLPSRCKVDFQDLIYFHLISLSVSFSFHLISFCLFLFVHTIYIHHGSNYLCYPNSRYNLVNSPN